MWYGVCRARYNVGVANGGCGIVYGDGGMKYGECDMVHGEWGWRVRGGGRAQRRVKEVGE